MRLPLILALGLATAAQAETRLSDGVSLALGTFSSGGGLTVATEFRRTAQGGTALCGAWAESESQASYTTGEARRIVQLASVYVQGQRVAQDLGALPQIAPRLDYAGAPAGCIPTDLPWRAGRVPEVFLPRQQISRSGGGGSDPNIIFRQSGPGAMGAGLEVVPFLRRLSRLLDLSPAATIAEGRYSSGGGVRVAAELVSVNRRAHVCGLWSDLPEQDVRTEALGRAILRRTQAVLDGRVMRDDLGELRRARARIDYTGVDATCLETGQAWRSDMTHSPLALRLPETVVYRDTTPEGRVLIRFAPVKPQG
ncbi:MAG: orotidine 5-phosphate decarboxylase [Roseovarius sp.]|uniref:orotidine 5-phosphate decarboxylase n=1 Tax=Roseovarius sp. TaxID=1486281 RepID=UPI0032EDB436